MIDFSSCCPYLTTAERRELTALDELPPNRGGVVNPVRISLDQLTARSDCRPAFYHPFGFLTGQRLGRTLEHAGGAFYLMDPSALVVSGLMGSAPQEVVLDLCAAPGGKTIAYALLHPDSLIVANDQSFARAKELTANIERLGLANVIATCHPAEYFQLDFGGFFDRVILDAPCSGSGMFRKEPAVAADWSLRKVKRLAGVQKSLIETAFELLAPGGRLSYSTCSFSLEEDEEVVEHLLNLKGGCSLVELPNDDRFYQVGGRVGIHLFPHRYPGEGHYLALLQKDSAAPSKTARASAEQRYGLPLIKFNSCEYLLRQPFPGSLEKLRPFRPGIPISDAGGKGPLSHHLARFLIAYPTAVDLSRQEAVSYMAGNELPVEQPDASLALVRCGSLSLGWAKIARGRLKNYLPKGLRQTLKGESDE